MVYRSVEYSYFQNVVESSYSFAFYSWEDWEKLIDWQALVGINLGLAYTGQARPCPRTASHPSTEHMQLSVEMSVETACN